MTAPRELRHGNVAAIVEALRQQGAASRTELARATGLSRTTVVSILEELEAGGFVTVRRDGDASERGVGRPAATVALHPAAGVALGIDMGREHVRLVLVDLSLAVLAERTARFEYRTATGPRVELMVELADQAFAEAGIAKRQLVGAALGLPSPLDPHTSAVHPRILPDWDSPTAREMLSERLATPVTFENDANLEAFGELAMGAAAGMRDVIYVHVGWGIGGAVVLGGRIRRGSSGMAGELAHLPVRGADGPPCRCGRRGCLGRLASGGALLEAVAVAHGSELELAGLLALALDGDPGARRAMTDAGEEIGAVMAGLCTVLNPEGVVVGGELGVAGSPLIDGVQRRIDQDALAAARPVTVLPSALGPLGAALGAASLVVRAGDMHRIEIA